MNRISIGDSANTIILEGQGASAPYIHATPFFAISGENIVSERLEIQLKGTPDQISASLAALEKIIHHAALYDQNAYPEPQYLCLQLIPGGDTFAAEISNLNISCNPAGYKTHHRGSLLVTLHYTRPNYFDGPQMELPLNGRFGEDVTGGVTLYNHTDYHPTHGSSVYIKPAALISPMPAPLRIELENTTTAGVIKDIHIGIYHHPINDDETPFFYNAPDISGGSLLMDLNAINDYYRRLSWSAADWTAVASITLTLDIVAVLAGHSYRPMVHLFNSHLFSDLYMRFKLQRGSAIVYDSEPVYADPAYDYIFLPPVDLPPNKLLRETPPHTMNFVLYGYKSNGSACILDIDQIQFFPLDYAANFLGFFSISQGDTLIDDSFRGLTNVRYSAAGSEAAAQIRQGGLLLARPGAYSRLFFLMANENNTIDLMRTVKLQIFQRERRRIL